jgi:hypothetical protein
VDGTKWFKTESGSVERQRNLEIGWDELRFHLLTIRSDSAHMCLDVEPTVRLMHPFAGGWLRSTE